MEENEIYVFHYEVIIMMFLQVLYMILTHSSHFLLNFNLRKRIVKI